MRDSLLEARAALLGDDISRARSLFGALEIALPDDVEVRLQAAWARARGEGGDAEAWSTVEALARDALALHVSLALPLCIAGDAALRRGELAGARKLFRRAVLADPKLIGAQRGLRLSERRLRGSASC